MISQPSLAHTSGPRSKLFSNRLDLFSSLTSNKANNTIQTLQLQTVSLSHSGHGITSIEKAEKSNKWTDWVSTACGYRENYINKILVCSKNIWSNVRNIWQITTKIFVQTLRQSERYLCIIKTGPAMPTVSQSVRSHSRPDPPPSRVQSGLARLSLQLPAGV